MTSLPGASPKSSTPFKPRLLWRGALQLPDGTALPGIAFVSSAPPSFRSSSSSSSKDISVGDAITSSLVDPSPSKTSPTPTPPLTLPKEQQDALGLSIEMVRHAPINIVEVTENVERDEVGNLLKPRKGVSSISSLSSAASYGGATQSQSKNVHISYQAAGGIRMYVDPAFPSSVAYMERIFCYQEGSGGEEEVDKEKIERVGVKQHQDGKAASNVIVLSLDRSYSYSLHPLDREVEDSDDVFSESAPSTWLDPSSSSSSHLSSNATASEAVIMGVRVAGQDGMPAHVQLHIGQKVARKVNKKEDPGNTGQASGAASIPLGPRPDDPAPRALSRVLSAKYRANPQLLPRSASTSSLSSSTSRFLSPSLPATASSYAAVSQPAVQIPLHSSSRSIKRPSITNTLPNSEPRSSSLPVMKGQSSLYSPSLQDQSLLPPPPHHRQEKRAKTMSAAAEGTMAKGPAGSTALNDTYHDERKIEEKNRSLIKKLVHHQLLGKGLEKKDAEYLSCFNPTCNGTVLALRKHFYTDLIDKAQAVSIIEKHLDMYLSDKRHPLSAPFSAGSRRSSLLSQ